jgi:hypothetical protein
MWLVGIHERCDELAKEIELRHRMRGRGQKDAETRREKVMAAAAMNCANDRATGFGETYVATPCYCFRARPDRRRP